MSNWFPWNWGKSNDDPIKNLDPSLQKFLDKHQTDPDNNSKSRREPSSYREQIGLGTPDQGGSKDGRTDKSSTTDGETERPLPKESLFQDGRYKHIWATYKSLEEQEELGKSDQNKILDVIEGYRERQSSVSRAAQENCALLEVALHECYRKGTWGQIMKMCRDESRALDRCITIQSKFLRALGYADLFKRTEEESEQIQMHADLLYNRMLDYEKRSKEAKAQGRDPPPSEPLFKDIKPPTYHQERQETVDMPTLSSTNWDRTVEIRKANIEAAKFANLTEHEKELTKAELSAQLAVIDSVHVRITNEVWENYKWRMDKKERGVERPQDYIRRWFDFREYPEIPKDGDKQSKAEPDQKKSSKE